MTVTQAANFLPFTLLPPAHFNESSVFVSMETQNSLYEIFLKSNHGKPILCVVILLPASGCTTLISDQKDHVHGSCSRVLTWLYFKDGEWV